MATDTLGRRERTTDVLLRMIDDDVELRQKEQNECDASAETGRQAFGEHLHILQSTAADFIF